MIPQVILVTGAPRSGTTPLGDLLGGIKNSVNLYEPMGPTGDKRFIERFPIPGEPGFSEADLASFVMDMRRLKLSFKGQSRPAHRGLGGLAARVLGTRSLISYRKARLTFKPKLLIWKDPHAVFCAAEGPLSGLYKTIITVRPPLAHAASFKRLGWVSKAGDVYDRYRKSFGEIPAFSSWYQRIGQTPVGSAALLWHLVHRRMVELADSTKAGLYVLNMDAVASNELGAYQHLFDWLGVPMPPDVKKKISSRIEFATTVTSRPSSSNVHDFNRTAAQANSYWSEVLTPSEIEIVEEINGNLWSSLASRG